MFCRCARPHNTVIPAKAGIQIRIRIAGFGRLSVTAVSRNGTRFKHLLNVLRQSPLDASAAS